MAIDNGVGTRRYRCIENRMQQSVRTVQKICLDLEIGVL